MMTLHRLSSADFRTIRPMRRINGDFFSLSVSELPKGGLSAKGGPAPGGKWACVVSKKVSLKAVVRNLIKRRCRSVFQAELKNTHGPRALVLHAKRQAATASFAEIRQDIRKLLGRIE